MEPSNKITIVKRLILEKFYFLENHGFAYVTESPSDKKAIESIQVKYTSNKNNREVNIRYAEREKFGDIEYSFNIVIIRTPYEDVTDFFSFWIYLESINEAFNTSMLNYFNEKEAGELLERLAISLQTHTIDVIKGTLWLDKYWPTW